MPSPELGGKIAGAIVGERFNEPYPRGASAESPFSAGYPKRGVESDKKPRGTPAPLSHSTDKYTFIGDDGAFVANDPCRPAGSRVFVTGTVQLSSPTFERLLGAATGPANEGSTIAAGIIQHEIGHVLRLGHVQDPTQLMYEQGQNEVTSYADGDPAALAKLGQRQC